MNTAVAAKKLAVRNLSEDCLDALFNRRDILAIIAPQFVQSSVATYLAEKILADNQLTRYEAADFEKVGEPWFQADSPQRREVYLSSADSLMRRLDGLSAPFPCPIEQLHLLLDRAWPAGATVQRIGRRAMWYGLPRVLRDGAIEPHQDVLAWDSPDAEGLEGYKFQVAANVYLTAASEGGELALWSESRTAEEYNTLRIPGSYGLDATKIGPPTMVFKPEPGSLILFDSTRTHAVYAASGAPRVTFSCFIGYYGPDRPLTLWS